jgi:hypothetical protein
MTEGFEQLLKQINTYEKVEVSETRLRQIRNEMQSTFSLDKWLRVNEINFKDYWIDKDRFYTLTK